MIYVLCPDDNAPWGGVRKLYRHVDVLNQHGRPAAVLHEKPGFRCTWFENQTRIAYTPHTVVQPLDYVVMPEIFGPGILERFAGARKVVFNQNGYHTFRGWPLDLPPSKVPYTHPDVVAALTVSQDSQAYLQYAFPRLRVHRLRYAIDPKLFQEDTAKRPLIAYMPRKQTEDVLQVLHILRCRNALAGFTLAPIEHKTETDVAELLRGAQVFLSFGHPEGFGLPPAEAMACGCVTIGYHGGGGREFFTPQFGFPIEVGDIVGYARTTEAVLRLCREQPERLTVLTRKAADFIRETYSPANEAQDIVEAWQHIQGSPDSTSMAPITSWPT